MGGSQRRGEDGQEGARARSKRTHARARRAGQGPRRRPKRLLRPVPPEVACVCVAKERKQAGEGEEPGRRRRRRRASLVFFCGAIGWMWLGFGARERSKMARRIRADVGAEAVSLLRRLGSGAPQHLLPPGRRRAERRARATPRAAPRREHGEKHGRRTHILDPLNKTRRLSRYKTSTAPLISNPDQREVHTRTPTHSKKTFYGAKKNSAAVDVPSFERERARARAGDRANR